MVIEQFQKWNENDIIILMEEDGLASVQLVLYKEKRDFGGTAWIWDLWVDPLERKEGTATKLLKMAEEIAKRKGHQSVFIEWELKNSERWVLDWYFRRGYEEREFDTHGTYVLLEKRL